MGTEFRADQHCTDPDRLVPALVVPYIHGRRECPTASETVAQSWMGRRRLGCVLLCLAVDSHRHDHWSNRIRRTHAWSVNRHSARAWHPGVLWIDRWFCAGNHVRRESGLRRGAWEMDLPACQLTARRTQVLADGRRCIDHCGRHRCTVIPIDPRLPGLAVELCHRITRSRCTLALGS